MNLKLNKWKALSHFKIAVIAALFTSTLSQITSVEARETTEPNIKNRLEKVRGKLKQIKHKSDTLFPLENSIQKRKDKIIQAQYWSDGWNDWSNWSDGWNDWSDGWNDWSDGWSDWSDGWNDWSNWSNYW